MTYKHLIKHFIRGFLSGHEARRVIRLESLAQAASSCRLREWWCLLNYCKRPFELQWCRESELDQLFYWLSITLPKDFRLELWNGAFNHGLNHRKYFKTMKLIKHEGEG